MLVLILGSQAAREWMVQDLLPKVVSSDSIQLNIEGFNSPLFSYWSFDSLTLNIDEQEIINTNKFLFHFKLASLLEKKLDITELSAGSLLITIPNSNTQEAPNEASNKYDWQDILIPVRVQKLALNHVLIKNTELALPAFQARGKAELNWQDSLLTSNISIQTLVNPSAYIDLDANLDSQFSGKIKASIQEAAGGWLGKVIKLPQEQAVDFNLELSAKTDNTITSWKLHSFKMPWQKHSIDAQAQGSWTALEKKLEISQSSIFVDQKEQNIQGWWQNQLFELKTHLNELPISLANTFQNYVEGGTISGTVLAHGSMIKPQLQTNLQASTRYKNSELSISLKGEGGFELFKVEDAVIKLGDALLETSGNILLRQQKMDLKVHQLRGPVQIVALFDVELPDNLYIDITNTQGTLKGAFTAPNYSGFTQANSRYKEQVFEAQTNFKGNIEKININNFVAKDSGSQVQADGLIDWHNEKLKLHLATKKLPLDIISLLNIDLPNELSADINTDILLTGTFTEPEYEGSVDATGYVNKRTFDIKSKVKGDIEKIELLDFSSHVADGIIDARGLIDWRREQLHLTLNASNLPSHLASIAQLDLPEGLAARLNVNGSVSGSFIQPEFKGEASAIGIFQDTHFDITSLLTSSADHIELQTVSAKLFFPEKNTLSQSSSSVAPNASIQGKGFYRFTSKQLEGKIKVQDLPYQTLTLAGIDLPENLVGLINADLSIVGKLPTPKILGSIYSHGVFEDEPFSIDIVGSQQDQSLFFDNIKLNWNDTFLGANGLLSKENLDLHVDLQSFKLTDLNTFGYDLKPGNVNLNLNLQGSLEAPKLDGLVTLSVKNLDHTEDLTTTPEDIVVNSQLMTQGDTLIITSDVKQGTEAKGHLLITSQFKPFLKWLIEDTGEQKIADLPIAMSAKGNVGLTWINHFIDRDIQNISGKLSLDAELKGSLNQPRLNGSLVLLNGIYINTLSQTSIEEAEITLAFDEQSINILKAEATDGHTGKIKLSGSVNLADGDHGLIDIRLNLNKASIIRREDIEGDASGNIRLSGDFKTILVEGNIDVAPFQIMLDLIPSDTIPEIDVTLKEDANTALKGKIKIPHFDLNIIISVEQQAYIRSRGLDAELKGKLMLLGSIQKPRYTGQFEVIRGNFDLFTKRFKLEQGDVLFANDAISLIVQGKHIGKDYTFIASLSGTLDDLKIGLRTEPTLPEDEALARLLFGRSIRNISPFQAMQLAAAIQTLRGESSKFDPLSTARDFLHVDNITIESQEGSSGNGIVVGLGKYITEGVYVEITRTPEPTQPWTGSVEVELTPSLNLETTTGNSSGFGGVELQWKKDY
jgi:translocation and assembly module TamB